MTDAASSDDRAASELLTAPGDDQVDEPAPEPEPSGGPSVLRTIIGWVAVIGGALAVALVIQSFLVQAFYIPSSSMEPAVEVGDRVLVGMGATVMDGVVVENDVVIAAGALVTPKKTLRSGFLYAGSPAREMRPLSSGEMDYFCYSANNYVNLKNQHIEALEAEL